MLNMAQTSQQLTDKLTNTHNELRLLFQEDFEKASRRLKLSHYTNGNRAGRLLVNRIKAHRYKTQIPYILHPKTLIKLHHPQAIADAFSHYYGLLYNLDDNTIPQPTPDIIEAFLKKKKTSQIILCTV